MPFEALMNWALKKNYDFISSSFILLYPYYLLLFLKQTKLIPIPGTLCLLSPLPGMPYPEIFMSAQIIIS